eukprot:563887-Prorocentrum_minimum.AAC.1
MVRAKCAHNTQETRPLSASRVELSPLSPAGICRLPSRDRSPLQKYTASPDVIGPRYRNMPPPLAR